MLKHRPQSLDCGTWSSPVGWNQSTKHWTGSPVSLSERPEGVSYNFVPICHDGPWLWPDRDSFGQVGSKNASSGNGRDHINLGENAQLIQAVQRAKMKQGSSQPASREAERHSLALPSRFMWNAGVHQSSFD
jgi:hypothetical protein